MRCDTCREEAGVSQLDEGGFVRNACACERQHTCDKCKKRSVQVFLELDGKTIEGYRCRDHAALEHLEEQDAKDLSQKPHTDSIALGLRDVEKFVREDKTRVQCTSCQSVHSAGQRRVKAIPESPCSFQILCPKCNNSGYMILV